MHQFERNVTSYIHTHQLIAQHDHLLVACSGGIDSIGLLYFLHTKKEEWQIQISCAHVDHMLRGETSYNDLQFVETFCEQLNIPFYGVSIPIGKIIEQNGGNVQAVCRRERYSFLQETAENIGATKIVTAHHADDQVESVIMALATKNHVKSLAAIHPIREINKYVYIRPFLKVTKQDIGEYLQKNNLSWREDSSNAKDAYTRNKIRHHILPVLKEINPNVSENIVLISQQIKDDEDLLMQLATEYFTKVVTVFDGNCFSFKIEDLKREPVSLQRRLVLILLNYIYGDSNTLQTYHLTSMILNLCNTNNGTAEVHLPNNFIAERTYSQLTVKPSANLLPLNDLNVTINKWETINDFQFHVGDQEQLFIHNEDVNLFYFNSDNVKLPLTVRAVKDGDRIQLAGMNSAKRVSRIFIDEKIPVTQRQNWPLLVDANDEIVAILGIRVSNRLSKVKRPIDNYFIAIK